LELKKPIIIHTREAEKDTFKIMKEKIPKDWKVGRPERGAGPLNLQDNVGR
jgi:Tat protein secretion system quality control protein TatD with DNase activity